MSKICDDCAVTDTLIEDQNTIKNALKLSKDVYFIARTLSNNPVKIEGLHERLRDLTMLSYELYKGLIERAQVYQEEEEKRFMIKK